MFGDDNIIDKENKIQSYNIKNIGYILYFVDCTSNRFRSSDVELLNTLRYGFKKYNSIFWNKLIIVMCNTNEICDVNLKYRPPKNDKDAKKNYDKNFVSIIEENFEKTKKNIKKRIMTIAESMNEACQENFNLKDNFSLEFVVMDEFFPFIDIPYSLYPEYKENLEKKYPELEEIVINNIPSGYSELEKLAIKKYNFNFDLDCQVVKYEGLPTYYKNKYLVGTKPKRSIKIIAAWFVTVCCLNILIAFIPKKINYQDIFTISFCGVFDIITYYYRHEIFSVILNPCLYKYLVN